MKVWFVLVYKKQLQPTRALTVCRHKLNSGIFNFFSNMTDKWKFLSLTMRTDNLTKVASYLISKNRACGHIAQWAIRHSIFASSCICNPILFVTTIHNVISNKWIEKYPYYCISV